MNTNLNDLADLICTIDKGRPDKAYILRQLKGAAAAGFLIPDPNEYGPRGARVYPPAEICKARIYLAAVRTKVLSSTLRHAFDDQRFTWAVRDLSEQNTTWNLLVRWISTDEEELTPHFTWEHIDGKGYKDHWIANDSPNPDTLGTIESIQVFPFTRLCRPLLQKLNEANN